MYTLDDNAEERLFREQNECVFTWANKECWPGGVVMSYVFRDGSFWFTASGNGCVLPPGGATRG